MHKNTIKNGLSIHTIHLYVSIENICNLTLYGACIRNEIFHMRSVTSKIKPFTAHIYLIFKHIIGIFISQKKAQIL